MRRFIVRKLKDLVRKHDYEVVCCSINLIELCVEAKCKKCELVELLPIDKDIRKLNKRGCKGTKEGVH